MIYSKYLFLIAFSCLVGTGCSHTTLIKTDPPGGYLTLEGHSLGKVPEEGLIVKRKPGFGPVTYRVVYVDGFETSGILEREQPAMVPVGMAAMTGLVCLPTMCGMGVCMVNPGWLVGIFAGSVLSVGGCHALMSVASPWTLPAAGFMGLLGFLPSAILLKAEHLPSEVILHKVPTVHSKPGAAEEMPF